MTVLMHPASNLGTVDSDSRNYHGSLDRYGTRVADSDMVQIGSYTDTFYNQAVGTHPGTSLNSSVTTSPLFQCYDSSSSVDYLNFPNTAGANRARLIALDSDGDFRELDSEQTIAFGKRLLETSLSNERTGSWRIGTSTPSGGIWEMWNNNAFTDTTSSASTNYNVYRKTGETSGSGNVPMKELLGLMDSVSSVVGGTGTAVDTYTLNDPFVSGQIYPTDPNGLIMHQIATSGSGTGFEATSNTMTYNSMFNVWAVTVAPTLVSAGTGYAVGDTIELSVDANTTPGQNTFKTIVTITALSGTPSFTVQEKGSSDIQEMVLVQQLIAISAATKLARSNSELGKMVLLPSTQTPASTGETGTWQTRGTVVDTINTTENINYTSEYFTSISRTEQFTGSRQFVNRGSDQYTRFRFLDVAYEFAGVREAPYSGIRTNQQNGRNEQFSGQRFTSAQYAGNRQFGTQFVGTRQYAGNRANAADFVGTRQYAGQRPYIGKEYLQYLGDRNVAGQFGGFRVVYGTASFGGDRDFAGYRNGAEQGNYSRFVGTRQWSGVRYRGMQSALWPQYPQYAKFSGGRNYYNPGTYDFAGQRRYGEPWNQIISFLRQNYPYYTPSQFGGQRAPGGAPPQANVPYAGERYISNSIRYYQRTGAEQQWAGTRPTDIQRTGGNQQWAGQRWNPVTRFAAIDTFETFVGDRQFGTQFTGNRDDDFAGIRDENYTGQYTGQYSAPYTRNYIGQFSTQYAGETLTNLASTLETYTLYCKVSES